MKNVVRLGPVTSVSFLLCGLGCGGGDAPRTAAVPDAVSAAPSAPSAEAPSALPSVTASAAPSVSAPSASVARPSIQSTYGIDGVSLSTVTPEAIAAALTKRGYTVKIPGKEVLPTADGMMTTTRWDKINLEVIEGKQPFGSILIVRPATRPSQVRGMTPEIEETESPAAQHKLYEGRGFSLFDQAANVLVVIHRYEKCVTLAMLTVDEKGLPGKSSCPKGKPIVEATPKAGKALFEKLTTPAK
jgi:hypothetical protein